jgi:hypothetical protein
MLRTTLPSNRVSLLLLAGGCGDPDPGTAQTGDVGVTDTTGEASSTGGETPTTSGTSSTGDATTGVSSDPTTDFIMKPDLGPDAPCDPFAQNCPEGQKCAAWAEDGGSWDTNRCVPITGDQLPGEPCVVEGGRYSGLDDCVERAMCWNLDDAGKGTCIALCIGSADYPKCADPGFACMVTGSGVVNPCFPICDPLAQDCAGDDLCLPYDGTYLCLLDASGDGGAVFDPCEYLNGCDKGLMCLSPAAAEECDQGAQGCCLPMCSIADGGAACPGAGQECLASYEPQPSGFEDVGYCSVMP